VFPGGALVGCDAGTLNASRIKGSHAAIKTGMLAAEAAAAACRPGAARRTGAYPAAFEQSWLHAELDKSRNFKQWFKKGNTVGSMMTGIEQWLLPKLGIKSPPWTKHRTAPTTAGCTRPTRSSRSATPSPTASSPSTA
jgi:electron-transferring-flavoprotein dehydrogenase